MTASPDTTGARHLDDHHAELFEHDDGLSRSSPERLSSTTRYLCGAAYIDEDFADRAIREIVADSHRAVIPAIGYDVEAVLRHCFQARRLWAARNAALCVTLLAAMVIAPMVTLSLVTLALLVALPTLARRQKRWPVWKFVLVALVGLTALSCLAGPLVAVLNLAGSSSGYGYGYADTPALAPDGGSVRTYLVGLVVLALVLLGVLTWARHRMINTIITELAPGAPVRPPRLPRTDVEHRVGTVSRAQHGNVVLHSGFEPFVGAGNRVDAWSIVVELRPDEEPPDGVPPRPVRVDPVALVAHVRQRLAALRSRDLPEQERMTGLQLRDQVVAAGTRWHGYPLIDQQVRLPYAFATGEAVDAIIRFPQTSARHFLRASVGAQEKPAVAADGQTIMPSEHQSVVATAFTHIAVEGGMLYVEVVETVLGPLRQQYLDIDRYALSGDSTMNTALREAVQEFAVGVVTAPVGLARAIRRHLQLNGSMTRADTESQREPVYDFGARVDVREIASRKTFASYVQRLDSEKYLRLIERRIAEAVIEFLTAEGVDTSEFRTKFTQNWTATINGDVNGSFAMGTGATATASTPKGPKQS
ncbi:hypothetical protein [Jidongwangia harbinensis]|uniref:hypothetical protein n=1 Tax=Jidongwangia harbinensis TaxID=2878561 RepID=UPI001CD93D50|nr:hypothetical protein [Jidongwangia harbinensis]MCA2215391.1 hypothetical protein [Jidongwangia harbinensis]